MYRLSNSFARASLQHRSAKCRGDSLAQLSVGVALAFAATIAHAATPLADAPVFAVQQAPGNVALVLSVEYPTVISVAYIDRTYHASGPDYLGYFDPAKCYDYSWSSSDTTGSPATTAGSYFVPSGTVSNHICSGKWSGHFLNWATMQTIDPFRWVLTGGYRVRDDASLTVLEKAWATGQGGFNNNFPDGSIASADVAGATPFGALGSESASALQFSVQGHGNQLYFGLATPQSTYTVNYYNCTDFNCPAIVPNPSTVTDFSAIQNYQSPSPGVGPYNFGARYTATVTAPQTGAYNFRILADDGARLYLNGSTTPILTTTAYNALTTGGPVNLTAGVNLTIRLDYFQGPGAANVSFEWQLPDGTWMPFIQPAATVYTDPHDYRGGRIPGGRSYQLFVRTKVCDPSSAAGGLETNCVAYGSNYKPQGLIHTYSNKLRFSAFGYLNDTNLLRDGGILRARQKFVGPTQPVPGSPPVKNAAGASTNQTTAGEWDPVTGVYVQNPDKVDADATNTTFSTSVGTSGVMNYLNMIGEITHGPDKGYDPVSELYYAAIRYYKNLGNVPEWSNMTGASPSDANRMSDGFPVITAWDDPILYYCQKNFILGIGDVNTHADKNVPGNTNTNNEPSPMPKAVSDDTTVNAITATNVVGALEGMGPSLGTQSAINGVGDSNSAAMAGLAYDSHVKDIRPKDFLPPPPALKQAGDISTIDTYWVDVQEARKYYVNNQFYLAAKYGGFTVPGNYVYGSAVDSPPNISSWHNNNDTFVDNGDNTPNNKQVNLRPDNYFSGGSPDLMRSGLTAAFASFSSKQAPATTAFATALSQVGFGGNVTFSSQYNATTWTSEVTAGTLSFDAINKNTPTSSPKWTLDALLKTQLTTSTGWDLNRRVVTWNTTTSAAVPFRSGSISSDQLTALDTTYVANNDSANFLKYVRGDQTNEKGSTASGTTAAYRTRTQLLGDIVDSRLRVVGPPSFPYLDATNPGYSAFRSAYASRPTVVYFGANDGMLHAIDGDQASATTNPSGLGGTELFAYIPSALFNGPSNPQATGSGSVDGLASLGNPAFTHHFMVDATPAQYDVDFTRIAGATPTTQGDWHSLLIGGLGKGGKSYYAIDVTDSTAFVNAAVLAPSTTAGTANEQTVANKVLWEFSGTSNTRLGYSFGDPIVAKTKKWGWVVVLTSGYNNSDGQGYVFLLNPKTGALLDTLPTGEGSLSNDAGLAQINSFINDGTDGTVDSLYAGDLLGNLWRFDLTALSGTYPAPTKIAVLTDSNGTPQPVTTAPSISVDPLKRIRFVTIGTGRLLDSTDISSTQQQTFYAIADGSDARFNAAGDLPKNVTFPIGRSALYNNVSSLDAITFDSTTQAGWFEDLGTAGGTGTGSGWRVVKNTNTLAGEVVFSTIRPDLSNVCSPSGTSRLYGRSLIDTKTIFQPVTVGSTSVDKSYYDYPSTITDQQFFSVNGTAQVLVGTTSGLDVPAIKPLGVEKLKRLNWRELRVVD